MTIRIPDRTHATAWETVASPRRAARRMREHDNVTFDHAPGSSSGMATAAVGLRQLPPTQQFQLRQLPPESSQQGATAPTPAPTYLPPTPLPPEPTPGVSPAGETNPFLQPLPPSAA